MTYLDELKEFVVAHAKTQNIPPTIYQPLLTRITEAEGEQEGSWAYEWLQESHRQQKNGDLPQAMALANLARFPFVNSDLKKQAHARCIELFDLCTQRANSIIEKFEIPLNGKSFRIYFAKMPAKNAPLLIVMGGIISIKEQWYQLILMARWLGLSVVLAEHPGVGENNLPYTPDSYHMFGAILDSLAAHINVDNTIIFGGSFSGCLAVKQALVDSRIKSLITLGAPLHHFFNDAQWWNCVPLTTKYTLAHILDKNLAELFDYLNSFAISENRISQLAVPFYYIRSIRDEVIPKEEKNFLVNNVKKLKLTEYDDVHASPNHMDIIRKYLALTILQQCKGQYLKKILLKCVLVKSQLAKKIKSFIER